MLQQATQLLILKQLNVILKCDFNKRPDGGARAYKWCNLPVVIGAVLAANVDIGVVVDAEHVVDVVAASLTLPTEPVDLAAAVHASSLELLDESSLVFDFGFSEAVSLSFSFVDSVFSMLFVAVDSDFSSLTEMLLFASNEMSAVLSSSLRSVSVNGLSG